MATRGWRCFHDKAAPVVYISPALHMDLGAYLASEFGIGDCQVVGKGESPLADVEGRMVILILLSVFNEN